MATVGERIATLEARLNELREDVNDLKHTYHGGGGVTYEHSIRGRLHVLENTVAGFVLRRSFGLGMLKGWQATILLLCGLVTAGAAIYGALHH